MMTVDGSKIEIEKIQFHTPKTFQELPLHSHCYGGCAILPAYLRPDTKRTFHAT